MIKCPVEFTENTNFVDPAAMFKLYDTGVYIPMVTRVIYNTGTKEVKAADGTTTEARPVLATIIEFADGTKSAVVNSVHDSLSLFDAEGQPTREAKESGFVYALAKRALCGILTEDKFGNLTCEMKGFGRILANYVDTAYDCQKAKKENAAKKAAAAKAHAERQANAKPKHASLAATVDKLAATVEQLSQKVNA